MTHFALRSLPPAIAIVLIAGCAPPASDPQTASTPERTPSPAADVTARDIQQTPGDPIEKLLMNKTPGVWVGRSAAGGIAVRIRGGSSSLLGNNDPLYILDGVPFSPGPDGSLTGINPYDIESIKVLKEAADITMYGSRGANGVLLITTKRSRSRPARP